MLPRFELPFFIYDKRSPLGTSLATFKIGDTESEAAGRGYQSGSNFEFDFLEIVLLIFRLRCYLANITNLVIVAARTRHDTTGCSIAEIFRE